MRDNKNMTLPVWSSLIDRAIAFAARAHLGQRRKAGDVPYIAHPIAVAMILLKMGCEETVVAAALLHDTVEDTDATLEEVRDAFGEEVAGIVAGVTEPTNGRKWETRKQHLIATLRDAPLPVKLVAAADKYHNLIHTLHNQQKREVNVWERFSRGPEQQAWYYRNVTESILTNVAHPEEYPIFDALIRMVDKIFDGIPSRPPE